MLEVRAFRALRFDFNRFDGDLSSLIAPPYDVLDENDKRSLLSRSDRNIVAIDLPHLPPQSAGPPERYEAAGRTLRNWRADGTLIRDPDPALYVCHQSFAYAGRSFTRRMFIACLRLEAFDRGIILPHERTFGGPKEDRLALMKATRCQLSPIFGLYSDSADRVGAVLGEVIGRRPDANATLDGVENRLWSVTDSRVIDAVTGAMREKKVYIADGHHRYGTALMYRDWLRNQDRSNRPLPDEHPAHFVMFVLASMDDPGCLILPYYRTIAGIDLDTLLQAWSEGVEMIAWGPQPGTGDLTLHDGVSGREVVVRFTRRDVLRELEPKQVAPWYGLDYAYLHRYLIDELLTAAPSRVDTASAAPKIHYLKSPEEAKRVAREQRGVALLVKATPMAHLKAVSEAGGLMPQKSTYFHPKLATGMTMYSLE